jgi:hypothetical protein
MNHHTSPGVKGGANYFLRPYCRPSSNWPELDLEMLNLPMAGHARNDGIWYIQTAAT